MPRNSLKKLLDKFPYFLDKSDSSNFTKTQKVFNNRLADVYNELFQVYLAGKLEKNLLIWKEQSEANEYTVNFLAEFPYLESVTCMKNDEVIYSEYYEYEDEINIFFYSYDSTSENIISDDKFTFYVTTYEEYSMSKGFPENDTIENNIYDHDTSLDAFGEVYDIPRKTYKTLTDNDLQEMSDQQVIDYYLKTEPSFNNQATEDDYHYMNRIIQYIQYLPDIPLPVLEIWKLYGLDPEDINQVRMVNRERYLCKMFEKSRHVDETGEYDNTWTPERWEHKDPLYCPVESEVYFFARVDNASPIEGRSINFTFNFYDALAKKVNNTYYIVPYVNDEIFSEGFYLTSRTWNIPTENFPGITSGISQFDFIFRAYNSLKEFNEDSDNYLLSDEIRVIIKGCDSADLYIDCINGDDSNDGTTRETALKTLPYALNMIEGSKNVIALINNNERFYIDNPLKITENCSIISCPKGAVIYQNNGWDIFKVMQDTRLYLQNITLKHKCCELYATGNDFDNQNIVNYPFNITIPKWVCKIATKINMTKKVNVYAHHDINLNGTLLTEIGDYEIGSEITSNGLTTNCPVKTNEADEPVNNEEIELYYDDTLLDTTNTDNKGAYDFTYNFTKIGDFVFNVIHQESKKYCVSTNFYNIHVDPMPTTITASADEKIIIDESFTVDYNVTDYYQNKVTVGTIKLYEGTTLLKTVNNGKTLSYTPTTVGTHTYKLVYSYSDGTYVTSETTFTVTVTKLETSIILLGEGKSTYLTTENIKLTGLIRDEQFNPITNASVKLYDGTSIISTLTSDNKGEISWNNKLTKGTHVLHLEYDETRKYYSSISNNYRVRVRESELADINLILYPEHKVLLSKATLIPVKVYACDKNGNPLKTTFKILDTYNSGCQYNDSTTYTTGADGWCSLNVSTNAIKNCQGTYLQAISTIDEDVYSNVAHVVYTVEPELTVSGDIFTNESYYSYSDDIIHVEGYMVDNEDDPVPNENITVKMIVDNTVIESQSLTTDVKGEWNTTFTTNSNVRGKDLTFKVEYTEIANKYSSFTESTIVEFKQLSTKIVFNNITAYCGDIITLEGSVVDENNRNVDTGTLTLTLDNTSYSKTITEGVFSESVDTVFKAGTYPISLSFAENTFYKKSSLNKNLIVKKVTPTLNVISEYSIPVLESFIIPFGISRNTRIPLTGTVKLTGDGSEIVSVDANATEFSVLFDETKTINATLTYSGNDYLNTVSKIIVLTVYGPYYIITCNKNDSLNIELVDEFPNDNTSDEFIVLTELDDNYPKLIITSDVDYDTSTLGDDDKVIIDTDDSEPDIILFDEGDD